MPARQDGETPSLRPKMSKLEGPRRHGSDSVYKNCRSLFSVLDFAFPSGEKQREVVEHSVSLYAQWRLRSGVVPALRENGEPPPERLLQAVRHHQRIQRDKLATIDGQTLQVL